jgi:hypothetical protein
MPDVTIVCDKSTPPALLDAMSISIRSIDPNVTIESIDLTELPATGDRNTTYCWLTMSGNREIDRLCRDLSALRQLAVDTTGVKTGDGGNLWLPVIWTARGPIYGEAIGRTDDRYQQPIHLDDPTRQPLYQFAYRLLDRISPPPATYLIQFQSSPAGLIFDRLLPFPAAPATASIGVQQPNLFDCHWLCLNNLPIVDVFCL